MDRAAGEAAGPHRYNHRWPGPPAAAGRARRREALSLVGNAALAAAELLHAPEHSSTHRLLLISVLTNSAALLAWSWLAPRSWQRWRTVPAVALRISSFLNLLTVQTPASLQRRSPSGGTADRGVLAFAARLAPASGAPARLLVSCSWPGAWPGMDTEPNSQ